MDFTFLKNGTVAFSRNDAEQAEWTQEEFSLLCTFPYIPQKAIERGMTVLFADPATGAVQAYEIRNCTVFPGEAYQQFTAEDIAIAELTDCHIPGDIELTDVSAKAALTRVLSGTGWAVGTDSSTGKSSGDIGRGSVWEAVTAIRGNWNIYVLPRVTVSSTGITGRYLDILPPEGVFRGLRIAIDKNVTDPCVTYDDSELYTALYAYGASYTEGDSPETQTTKETDISGITWSKTSSHPAKPAGQKYLEWPEKTTLYGRNGKARFGYYQNTAIKDPNILIQKTWQALKNCSDPKISITGTVTDLRRLGYADEPLRLYDQAIVDLGDVQFYKQVIKLTVNLLDPTGNSLTIGDYIPNIIYINRETEDFATGGGKGVSTRGGGGGRTRSNKQQGEFETDILQNERNIIMEARQVDENRQVIKAAGMKIDPITGVIIYAEDVPNGIGSNFKVQSNAITAEVNSRKSEDEQLRGLIRVQANKISLVVTERDGRSVVNEASIVLAINKDNGSTIKLKADTVDLGNYATVGELNAQKARVDNLISGHTTFDSLVASSASLGGSGGGSVRIYGNTVRIYTVKDTAGTTRYVYGYA
jgi:hypothetical protein